MNTIPQSVIEFSIYDLQDQEIIVEEGKVLVTSGLVIDGDSCLVVEGMVYLV